MSTYNQKNKLHIKNLLIKTIKTASSFSFIRFTALLVFDLLTAC